MGIWDDFLDLCDDVKDKVDEIAKITGPIAKNPGPGPIIIDEPKWIEASPMKGRGSSFVDNVFRDKVTPVEGSVVCCDLAVLAEHSGIYIGDGRIAHRDGGGYLDIVSPREFVDRLDGLNNAISVYVSCRGANAVGSKNVADRARNCVSDVDHQGYNLFLKNCHQFCQYCLTKKNSDLSNCTFLSLELMLARVYKADNWRVWDINIW